MQSNVKILVLSNHYFIKANFMIHNIFYSFKY